MRRQFNAVLLACVIVTAVVVPHANAETYPAQQEAQFRALDFDWVDDARGRRVPARLYWPTDAAPGRTPLIVFSHGIGGSRNGYTYLAKRWAAQGVASLHVQHTGSDRSVWRGNPFEIVNRLQAAAHESEAAARAGDTRFALDQILSKTEGPYARFVDAQRIIAAGHSYGANTTLLSVGARVLRDGRWLDFHDRRYKAAIVISAPPFYGERDLSGILANISVPTLHVTSTEDVIRVPGYYSPASDRLAIFNAMASQRKRLVVFQGGSHSMFTDRALTGGANLNPMVKDATAAVTLSFLDYAFRGDASSLTQWETTWQNILVQPVAGARAATMAKPAVDLRAAPFEKAMATAN